MNTSKIFIGAIVVAIVIACFSLYIATHEQKVVIAGASAVGTTNSAPKSNQIVANGNTGTYVVANNGYTYASLTNSDSQDRVITSIDYFYQGLGQNSSTTIAALTLQAATSSDSTTLNSNTNYVLSTQIATSTSVLYTGSSTPGTTTTNANRIWLAGSNLNFISNGTTSANVIIRVNYIPE